MCCQRTLLKTCRDPPLVLLSRVSKKRGDLLEAHRHESLDTVTREIGKFLKQIKRVLLSLTITTYYIKSQKEIINVRKPNKRTRVEVIAVENAQHDRVFRVSPKRVPCAIIIIIFIIMPMVMVIVALAMAT